MLLIACVDREEAEVQHMSVQELAELLANPVLVGLDNHLCTWCMRE